VATAGSCGRIVAAQMNNGTAATATAGLAVMPAAQPRAAALLTTLPVALTAMPMMPAIAPSFAGHVAAAGHELAGWSSAMNVMIDKLIKVTIERDAANVRLQAFQDAAAQT